MKIIKFCLLLFCLTYLVSCGQANNGSSLQSNVSKTFNSNNSLLAEMPSPKIIKKLNQELEQYKPQVEIISPKEEQTINQTNVSVRLGIKDLPVFKDEKLNLGNHLSLILDNEPAKQVYDVRDPVMLEDLTPGTHCIRVFATRPWGESFKNDGAFAQISFSVLTETNNNRPDRNLPLLTYNNPTGIYGAEPFLLDFYLTNAPLHSVAKNNPQLLDWQIKATVNGDSFMLENWQPVYLAGLNKGENWIQLELIDEAGNSIENVYNNTVRVITYDPQQQDTISKLVTDQISLADAQPIIEQNYYIQPVGEPEIIEPTIDEEEISETITETIATEKEISEVTEPTINDKTEAETPIVENDNEIPDFISKVETESSLNSNISSDIIEKQTPKQPIVSTSPAAQKIEKADKTIQEIPTGEIERAKSAESKQVITIVKEDSDLSEPVTAVEIPQSESVEITGNEIAITIPETESSPVPEIKTEAPVWWKKILVGLRQKLESLVRLLPSEV